MHYKIGLKTDLIKSEGFLYKNFCKYRLREKIDYLEYQAPLLNLEWVKKIKKDLDVELYPHEAWLSTSIDNKFSSKMIHQIKKEIDFTKAKYLGIHLGRMSLNEFGPNLGYVFPPRLNLETVDKISENINHLVDELDVPLALENPVFYVVSNEDNLKFSEFISKISNNITDRAGWLIDYAHLKMSCGNVSSHFELDSVLDSYFNTKRPIFEVHLANISRDLSGVYHDDHSNKFDKNKLKYDILKILKNNIFPQNWTIERSVNCENDMKDLIEDLNSLKNNLKDFNSDLSCSIDSSQNENAAILTSDIIRKKAEHRGRLNILKNRLFYAIPVLSKKWDFFCKEIFEVTEHDFLEQVWEYFCSNNFEGNSIGTYDSSIADGIDVAIPFISFVFENIREDRLKSEFISNLIVDASISVVSSWGQVENGQEKNAIIINISSHVGQLKSGKYLIKNVKKNVMATRYLDSKECKKIIKINQLKGELRLVD